MQGDNGSISGRPLLSGLSPGVQRIEIISSCFESWHRWVLFGSIFLVAYGYGLDGTIRSTYQGYATASYSQHSLLATVNVVRSIVAAATQPAYAKVSDVFGRITILLFATAMYAIGTVIEAVSNNVEGFSGGAILYQLGYTGIILLVEILIADTTSLRNRLLASFIPAFPFLINAWISGNIIQAAVDGIQWRWGIGMWAIIFPVCTVPLFLTLLSAERRAKKRGLLEGIPSAWRSLTSKKIMTELFWQIDLPGLILLAATLALILLPLTLAGGEQTQWHRPHIIATLVVGGAVALPGFVFWEWKLARHPLIPFHLLKNRTIIAGLAVAMALNLCWTTQYDFLYAVLIVAYDQTPLSANRILNIYSFTSTCTGIVLGLIVRRVRRVKWFAVAGTCLFMTAFGILLRFRGSGGPSDVPGLIGGQFLLGLAGGLFAYPTQALVQAATRHEHVAVITSLYLATYNVGSSIGYSISGAVWTQRMPRLLVERLAGINPALAISVYEDPYTFAGEYAWGTPERDAVVSAYGEGQRLLVIMGLCLSTILIIASLCLKNYYLGDEQSRPEAEVSKDTIRRDREGEVENDHDRKGPDTP